MKNKVMITKVRTVDGRYQVPVTTSLDAIYEKLRSGENEKRVEKLALAVTNAVINGKGRTGRLDDAEALPYLLFSATFGKGGFEDVRQRTGLLVLSVDCSEGIGQIAELRSRVAQIPYTLLAFMGSSCRTLKVVVRCGYAGDKEPQTADDYEQMLTEGYETAARLYSALAGCEVKSCHPTLLSGCRMSSDRNAFYQPDAQVLTVIRMKDSTAAVRLSKQGDVLNSVTQADQERLKMEYYACLDKAMESAGDAEELVQALAHYCFKAHLPEELCVQNTMLRWVTIPVSDELKRRIFRSVYKKPLGKGRPQSQMNEKERIARSVKDFFDRRYELRFNEVKQIEEFRQKGDAYAIWQPLSKRELKRIAFEVMMEGGHGWSVDIENYVQSSLVKSYNPITEFLNAAAGYYDPSHDYIGELARRVPTDYPEWERYFHRWMLAMVAQWTGRSRDFGNAVVPMLIGKQGTHKTTFCKMLLPKALREYYMDDIKMENAEQVERVLGRMALVNIDEYNAKTEREQAKIKRLLTEKDVQVRRMRSDQYTLTSRLCSFIATTNDRQPLPAGDGTRRYLCVELTGIIETESPIDYPRLYAQIMHELAAGEPFRFFPHEEAEIQEHNRHYQQQGSAEEALLSYFKPAVKAQANFMRAVDIQEVLKKYLRSDDVPNIKQLTVTLKQCGFRNGSVNGRRGWYAEKIEG